MIAPCIDCGEDTGLIDTYDFYFRCPEHIGEFYNVEPFNIPLTARELQVALFVADGLTNSEIGHELNLTMGYVRNIVSRVLRKLDAPNRRQINRSLRQWGL